MNDQLRSLSYADFATLTNATFGFLAIVVAPQHPSIAARFILLAAVADGIDGILARRYGSSPFGVYLDSLSDVVSFVIAPAILITSLTPAPLPLTTENILGPTAIAVTALFVAMALLRLGFYTADDLDHRYTTGVPTTLAASILSASYLAGVTTPSLLIGITAILSYLMISGARYPDLFVRDALLMGTIQISAIITPTLAGRLFPTALLLSATSYLLLSPSFYWRSLPSGQDPELG